MEAAMKEIRVLGGARRVERFWKGRLFRIPIVKEIECSEEAKYWVAVARMVVGAAKLPRVSSVGFILDGLPAFQVRGAVSWW
jgi:hypothetical protein